MSLNKNKNVNSQHVNINNISENNTRKELLDVLSKLKKTEIVSMINHYNNKKVNSRNSNKNVNSRNSNKNVKVQNTGMNSRMNTGINITKKKITVPKNLNSLELKPTAPDNDQYNGV